MAARASEEYLLTSLSIGPQGCNVKSIPGDLSPGYRTTPRERGSEAGFIRRRFVARALMPAG